MVRPDLKERLKDYIREWVEYIQDEIDKDNPDFDGIEDSCKSIVEKIIECSKL